MIKPPRESDADSMMPLVSPMNDVEFEDGGENNGNNYFPPEGREETSPLVDLGGDGKNMTC